MNYEKMDVSDLLESQAKDDRPEQYPEHSRTFPMADPSVLDAYLDPDAGEAFAVARTMAEQRPNINGIPNVYDHINAWTYKMRFGGYSGAHPKGCRTHGMEYWRVLNMQTGVALERPYCAECKRVRRGGRAR